GEEHLRFELSEFGCGSLGGIVLGAGRPDGADRCGGEERHKSVVSVRQVADDSVALSDSASAQPRGDRTDLAPQLTPGELDAVAVLGDGDDRGLVDQTVIQCRPQCMLGIIEPGPGEPAGTR